MLSALPTVKGKPSLTLMVSNACWLRRRSCERKTHVSLTVPLQALCCGAAGTKPALGECAATEAGVALLVLTEQDLAVIASNYLASKPR